MCNHCKIGSKNATSLMLLILAQKELSFEISGWVMGSETNHVSVGQNSSPQCQQLSVSAKMLQIHILVRFAPDFQLRSLP